MAGERLHSLRRGLERAQRAALEYASRLPANSSIAQRHLTLYERAIRAGAPESHLARNAERFGYAGMPPWLISRPDTIRTRGEPDTL